MKVKKFVRMFKCDTARIVKPTGRMFLILGWNCTRTVWLRNGESFHFDYLEEKVVASGDTPRELERSAKEYKRLSDATMEDLIAAKFGGK